MKRIAMALMLCGCGSEEAPKDEPLTCLEIYEALLVGCPDAVGTDADDCGYAVLEDLGLMVNGKYVDNRPQEAFAAWLYCHIISDAEGCDLYGDLCWG